MSSPSDLAASVRQRLRNLAISGKEDFQAVLTRFALERFFVPIQSISVSRSIHP
jgi:hypothetical protein